MSFFDECLGIEFLANIKDEFRLNVDGEFRPLFCLRCLVELARCDAIWLRNTEVLKNITILEDKLGKEWKEVTAVKNAIYNRNGNRGTRGEKQVL